MEVAMPLHHAPGVSQIGTMARNPGSGILCGDQPPRVSWGFASLLFSVLYVPQTLTSVLDPEVPGNAGVTNAAEPTSVSPVPFLGSLKPHELFTELSPEGREMRVSTRHQSS